MKPGAYHIYATRTGYVDYDEDFTIAEDKQQSIIKIEMTARDYTPKPDESFTADSLVQMLYQQRLSTINGQTGNGTYSGTTYQGATAGNSQYGYNQSGSTTAVVPFRLIIRPQILQSGVQTANFANQGGARIRILDSYNGNFVVLDNNFNLSTQGTADIIRMACLEQSRTYTIELTTPGGSLTNSTVTNQSFSTASSGYSTEVLITLTPYLANVETGSRILWNANMSNPTSNMSGYVPINCPNTTGVFNQGTVLSGQTVQTSQTANGGVSIWNSQIINASSQYKVEIGTNGQLYLVSKLNGYSDQRPITLVVYGDGSKGLAFIPAQSGISTGNVRWYVTSYTKTDSTTSQITINLQTISASALSPQEYVRLTNGAIQTNLSTQSNLSPSGNNIINKNLLN
jgi:hypothetical protein